MGLVHVLTGPDHLSAVATLACGNSYEAFWLGCRWGAGHSIGLFLVFMLILTAKVETNSLFMGTMEWWMTISVGVLMICLGVYGILHPDSTASEEEDPPGKRKQVPAKATEAGEHELHPLRPHHQKDRNLVVGGVGGGGGGGSGDGDRWDRVEEGVDDDGEKYKGHASEAITGRRLDVLGRLTMTTSQMKHHSHLQHQALVHGARLHPLHLDEHASFMSCQQMCASFGIRRNLPEGSATTSILALLVGIVHGAAGPGAVLGVLPAVALRDPGMTGGYFFGFIVATILTMGAFAALFGKLTKELGDAGGAVLERRLMLMSNGTCVVVGIAWIGLTLAGVTLD